MVYQDIVFYQQRQRRLFATEKNLSGWRYYEDNRNPEKYSYHFLSVDRPGFTESIRQQYLATCEKRAFVRFHVNNHAYFPPQSIPGYGDPVRKTLTFMVNQVKHPQVDLLPSPIYIQRVDLKDNRFYQWLYQTNVEYGETYAIANAKRLIEVSKQFANILHFVAILEGKIVGQLTLYLWEKVAELDEFYVLASQQGKGIGTKLYQHAMMQLNQRGMEEVFLVTDPTQPAKLIYERWGFLEMRHYDEVHFQKLKK